MTPEEKIRIAEKLIKFLNEQVGLNEKRTSTGISQDRQDKIDILAIATRAL